MPPKLTNLLLILTSLLGYLEWGSGSHSFLFQVEAELLVKLFVQPRAVLHPFTVLPLLGQALLLLTLFQKKPSKWLTYTGMAGLAVLLLLIFAIGMMGMNVKIIASAVPFLCLCAWTMLQHRKAK